MMENNVFRRCDRITAKNKYGENDEYIIFNNEKYVWCGCGVSGRAYVSINPIRIQNKNGEYRDKKCILKIMPFYDDEIYNVNRFDNEVNTQRKAAEHNIGPTIYDFGKNINIHSDDSPFEFKENSHYCQFNKLHYILMEYYDKNDGWKQLKAFELKNHTNGLCSFVKKMVKYAGIVNLTDPAAHFFYHPVYGYRMIDYDAVVDIKLNNSLKNKNDNDILKEIEESLLIKCSVKFGPVTRSRTTQRYNPLSGRPSYKGGKRKKTYKKIRRTKK
jgi:hypothetical protein